MAKGVYRQKKVEVFDTPSGMGGSFTVSIDEVIDTETVKVRIWYGRATPNGWESWPEWDAVRLYRKRSQLTNKRMLTLRVKI